MCNTTAGHLAYKAKEARHRSLGYFSQKIEREANTAAEDGKFFLKKEFAVTSDDINRFTTKLKGDLEHAESNFKGVEVSAVEDPKVQGDYLVSVSVSWLGVPEVV